MSTQPLVVRKSVDSVVVHFAGDSGDGMQISGAEFSAASATLGNAVQTFPDFPAEIRAPAGTLAGVSGFQCRFSDRDIHTPGDEYDCLVAMNPAALAHAQRDLKSTGMALIDQDKFTLKEYEKAGVSPDLIERLEGKGVTVIPVPMTKLTLEAVDAIGLSRAQSRKCKNFFALGLVYWLYDRPIEHTLTWLKEKFADKPDVESANRLALEAGYRSALAMELFQQHYQVKAANLPTGDYRYLSGNQAMALGCVAAAALAEKPLFFASYPITPASDILHQLSQYTHLGIQPFQAEDEMAAAGAALGAAYGGALAVTSTSGPGLDLKMEMLGLAVMAELPMVVINVQRAGPSTGMPTKTEQSDLLAAIHGRHGEAPIPVLAPRTPSDCFDTIQQATALAQRHMTPVIVLSDAYLANGSEAWRIPEMASLPRQHYPLQRSTEDFQAFRRDPETLARPWAVPGTPGLAHRVGGLEKDLHAGSISYDPDNHQAMVHLRAEKLERIQATGEVLCPDGKPDTPFLVLGWGSTAGALQAAVRQLQAAGRPIRGVYARQVWPLPKNLQSLLEAHERIAVVELNLGQWASVIRSETGADLTSIVQVTGKPFRVDRLIHRLEQWMEGADHGTN